MNRSRFIRCRVIALVLPAGFLAPESVRAHETRNLRIEELSRSIDGRPSAELLLQRGEMYRLEGQLGAALSDYEAAERLNPRLSTVLFAQARALDQAGHPQLARSTLDAFLRREPAHLMGHVWRARFAAKLGRLPESVADYDRALALAAEPRPEFFLERAEIQCRLGEFSPALAGLDAGLQRLGSLVSLHLPALDLEVTLGRYDGALRRVDALMESAERKEQWWAKRATILARAGRIAEATAARDAALLAVAQLPGRLRETPALLEFVAQLRRASIDPPPVRNRPVTPSLSP